MSPWEDINLLKDEEETLEKLFELWLEGTQNWLDLVENLTEEDFSSNYEYFDTSGKLYFINTGDALYHVFNHSTHHRGQISTGMGLLGHYCDELDFLYSPFIERGMKEE